MATPSPSPSSSPTTAPPINFPRSLVPPGSKPGDILGFSIEVDAGATSKVAADTRKVQRDLREGDPGGDITL